MLINQKLSLFFGPALHFSHKFLICMNKLVVLGVYEVGLLICIVKRVRFIPGFKSS